MKDIDFDELDRAVSSLMGAAPTSEPTEDTGSVAQPAKTDDDSRANQAMSPDSAAEAAENGDSSSGVPSVTSAESVVDETTEPTPSDQVKTVPAVRRGRYMDVVRPSAKNIHKATTPSRVSRQGAALQPVETSSSTPQVLNESENIAEVPPSVEDAESIGSPLSADEGGASGGVVDTAGITETATDTSESAVDASEDPLPLSSPFLPDAKVEKRPLGRSPEPASVSPSENNQTESIEPAPTMSDIDDLSMNKDAQLPEQPLPAELNSELLSIETGAEYPLPETTSAAEPVASTEQAAPAAEANPVEPMRTAAIASIPQQYKVKPSKVDETPASAIYDAQPLAHPAEKKPGWLWIAAILGIILLGVAGGVAVYYLGLI